MAYKDLLPDVSDLRKALREEHKLTDDQADAALSAFAWFVQEQADYFENRYQHDGDKRDLGANEELELLASNLRSASGYDHG